MRKSKQNQKDIENALKKGESEKSRQASCKRSFGPGGVQFSRKTMIEKVWRIDFGDPNNGGIGSDS